MKMSRKERKALKTKMIKMGLCSRKQRSHFYTFFFTGEDAIGQYIAQNLYSEGNKNALPPLSYYEDQPN